MPGGQQRRRSTFLLLPGKGETLNKSSKTVLSLSDEDNFCSAALDDSAILKVLVSSKQDLIRIESAGDLRIDDEMQ